MTPTEVIYRDDTPPVAGIAVGSGLTLPGTGRYEIYFIFPLTQQVNILAVLQTAVVTTGAILVVLLTFIAALVARQVVVPIRAARRAAESLASGNLDDRMKVRGRDDLARLATSMNYMASELQKQISQLEELSRVQQRFVSDVSHELRTPLTTVRMAAEVLYETREDFDPIAARSAELLQTELDRFEALLTDLLEISRFDAGAAVLAVSEVDLRDVVDRVVEASRAAGQDAAGPRSGCTRRNRATPRSTPAGSSGCCATCWSTPSSTARADRSTSSSSPTTTRWRWRSATTGSGSRPVRPSRCSTGSGGPTRPGPGRVGGTGLGLAISMEDANLHKGWLTAWGRPGMGAQFRLTVPRRSRAESSSPRRCRWCPATWCSPLCPSRRARWSPRRWSRRRADRVPPARLASPAVASTRRRRARRLIDRARARPEPPDEAYPLLLAVVVLLLGLVAGCVSVPTAGPVEKVEGQPPECQNCINVDVAPPAPGDEPEADRPGLPAGDVELPAELRGRPAVPHQRRRREVGARVRGLDLLRISPGRRHHRHPRRPARRVARPRPDLHGSGQGAGG